MMKTIAILLIFSSLALGQSTRRSEARSATRPALQPITKPTTQAATTRSVTQKYAAKKGAPTAISEWVAKWPYLHKLRIAAKQEEIEKAKSDLASEIDGGARASRSEGSGLNRLEYVDREAERRWRAKVNTQRQQIQKLVADKKKLEAEKGPFRYPMPQIGSARVGAVGPLGAVRVLQVVGEGEMIVKSGKDTIWLTGFDTSTIVDDKELVESEGVKITGTKKYGTVIGGSNTVYTAEPCRLDDWIELVEE